MHIKSNLTASMISRHSAPLFTPKIYGNFLGSPHSLRSSQYEGDHRGAEERRTELRVGPCVPV